MVELAVGFPIIRDDYIGKALETLYKHTPQEFRVFVMDQSVKGIDEKLIDEYIHYYIRPYQNLGFAKGANEMLWTAYRQGYPYIAIANDDIEYINDRWFEGIKEQFETDENILAVNPESPRVPLWGYGKDHGEYADVVEYKEEFTDEDYDYLLSGEYQDMTERYDDLPDSFPLKKEGVVDGFAMWHPVFKRECLEKIGFLDERFLYGGGEDYDYMARVYREGYRAVASMKSWVWHWWGKSKDEIKSFTDEDREILFNRPFWNDNDALWPPEENFGEHVNPWGKATNPDTGEKVPFKRVKEVKIEPL